MSNLNNTSGWWISRFVPAMLIAGMIGCSAESPSDTTEPIIALHDDPPVHNTLSEQEKAEGWILLFDGETSTGWRGYNETYFPDEGWVVENGTLLCAGSGGDILYDEPFHNYHLSLEWKISEGGNSGIFYLGQEIQEKPVWMSAPEMQILDNENHPDALQGVDGNRKAGSLYDLIPADPQNTRPAGEWNHAEIRVDQGTVTHFQNGERILEYNLDSPEFEDLVKNSKFRDFEMFAQNEPGYIALQDHGDDVWFRNIKIKVLEY